MLHPLTTKDFLKFGLTTPGYELSTIVGEDLSRCAPLADGTFDHIQHRFCRLLAKQTVAHYIAGVIIDDPNQIDPVHPLEFESENIDLPKRVRHAPFKTPNFRTPAFRFYRSITESRLVHYSANRLGADRKPLVPAKTVADPPNPGFGIVLSV